MTATYDLWSAQARPDPYPVYRQIQAEEPVHWTGSGWVLSRYDEVLAALGDPRWSADRTGAYLRGLADEERAELAPLARARGDMMLFVDPPRHTRLRGLVTQAFSAKAVERLRPRIQEITDGLLDRVAGLGRADLVRDLADPLPGAVIAAMLGVPDQDQAQIKHWADEFFVSIASGRNTPEVRRRGQESILSMGGYLEPIAAARRAQPRDDLITALVQAEEAGDRLSHEELVATCMLLLFGGNETTTNLIANGVLTLLRHPDALRQVRDHPGLIRSAVEELLRFESPIQYTVRMAKEPLEVAGRPVRAGETVTLLLGAANRDPAQFAQPERLDLARTPNRHLAFGHGPHFCLGAPLARAEGQIAIAAVVRRLADLALASEEVAWRESAGLRGLQALPVTFTPA